MASFIPNITDSPQSLSTTPFTQDYGFLQSQLYRSNSQYEQGLQEVKSDYSSILNMPVSGEEAQQRKQEYISKVQDGLKKVAPTDLSLPQNVAQAENLYSPFWKDEDLLTNSSLTRYYQNESNKLDGWENSTDKGVRSQYSQYSRLDLQNGLQKVADAPLDRNAYNKLDRRSATPFYDIDADINKDWLSEYGEGVTKGVSTVTTNGFGEQLTEYNGIKSKDAYKTYYKSKLASGKYDPQIQVMARVQNEQAKKEILTANPGLDEKSLNEHFATDRLKKLGDIYTTNAKTYQDQSNFYNQRYDDLVNQINNNQKGELKEGDALKLQTYWTKQSGYKKLAGQNMTTYYNEYSPVGLDGKPNSNYQQTFDEISTHPDSYIAKIEKDNMADSWATGRAAITAEKREADPVEEQKWKELDADAKNRIEIQRNGITARGQTLNYESTTGRDVNTGRLLEGADPTRKSSPWYGPGTDIENQGAYGHILGNNVIAPEHLTIQGIQAIQADKESTINNKIFDPEKEGYSSIVLGQIGLSKDDIIDFTEASKSMMNGDTLYNPQKLALWNKVKGELIDHGAAKDIRGPREMRDALIAYGPDLIKQLQASGNTDKMAQIVPLITSLNTIKKERDAYIRSNANINKSVQDEIVSGGKDYDPITVIDPSTEHKRMITSQDIAPSMPELDIAGPDGKIVHLNAEQVAKGLYIDGSIKMPNSLTYHPSGIFTSAADITINGTDYKIKKVTPPPGATSFDLTRGRDIDQPVTYKDYGFDHFGTEPNNRRDVMDAAAKYITNNRFGNPEEFTKLREIATHNAISHMGAFKNGVIAKVQGWDINASKKGNDAEENFALNLAPELSMIGNTSDFHTLDKGANPVPIDPDKVNALRAILSNSADLQANGGLLFHTKDAEGNTIFGVTFQAPSGTKDRNPGEFAGQTIYMKKEPHAIGKYINKIPDNNGVYIYGDMYNGQGYESSPTVQATGIKATVKPYSKGVDGNMTKANVVINRILPDKNDPAQTITQPVVDQTIDLTGPNAINPDELIEGVTRAENTHVSNYINNVKSAHNKGGTGIKFKDIKKQIENGE